MINHVVEYEPDRRIGWEPEAGRGHPNAEPGAERPARWGQRWSFELTPEGPEVTAHPRAIRSEADRPHDLR